MVKLVLPLFVSPLPFDFRQIRPTLGLQTHHDLRQFLIAGIFQNGQNPGLEENFRQTHTEIFVGQHGVFFQSVQHIVGGGFRVFRRLRLFSGQNRVAVFEIRVIKTIRETLK